MLLPVFLGLLEGWIPCFSQARSGRRAVAQAVGAILALGRRTLSRSLWALGRQQRDWSADYRLHARARWQPEAFSAHLGAWPAFVLRAVHRGGSGRHPPAKNGTQNLDGLLSTRPPLSQIPLQSHVGAALSACGAVGAAVPA